MNIVDIILLLLIASVLIVIFIKIFKPWLFRKDEDDSLGSFGRRSFENSIEHDIDAAIPEIEVSIESEDQLYLDNNEPEVIDVFFATDRNLTGMESIEKFFGIKNDVLRYGICKVSIPHIHRLGKLERPLFNWKFLENPDKHIVLQKIEIQNPNEFFLELSQQISKSSNSSAFIFIHGYNVTFHEAAIRTAQITYDLKFEGARCLYSWPSAGAISYYNNDAEEKIPLSELKLIQFLTDFFEKSTAENIYLIGHSMGTRALTSAVSRLIETNENIKSRLREIILSAPDINTILFEKIIAPNILKENKRITIYASSDDIPLKLSKSLNKASRIGESGENIFIMKGIDTIDATGLNTDFFSHTYFAKHQMVLNDIYNIIKTGDKPGKRINIKPKQTKRGEFWGLGKAAYSD